MSRDDGRAPRPALRADGGDRAGDEGYDEWLAAVAAGEAHYLACPEGHGWLPPRRICPRCGSTDLTETPLPDRGEIETFTVVHVAGPRFVDDAPYVTAVASFGPVRVTGVLRGVDPAAVDGDSTDPARIEPGLAVELDVGETATTGERVVVLRPAER